MLRRLSLTAVSASFAPEKRSRGRERDICYRKNIAWGRARHLLAGFGKPGDLAAFAAPGSLTPVALCDGATETMCGTECSSSGPAFDTASDIASVTYGTTPPRPSRQGGRSATTNIADAQVVEP